MTPTHSSSVGTATKTEFDVGLRRLQALLGRELRILVNFHGTFGGCLMQGKLTRVQTLPPDHEAVDILLDDRQGLMLDPIDTKVIEVGDEADDRCWLEFHLPSGVVAVVEEA